ncbi:MAG: aldehyde dehydrogenase family protein, partial [Oscillospiraceae bacterium]|nr:aldehyde dehydrogenase family protein [Oscillospiraceae bacterium]
MTKDEIKSLLEAQRDYFASGATLDVSLREKALQSLISAIKSREGEIAAALKADLGKGGEESYLCEIGMVLSELTYMKKHLRSFATERTVKTPLAQFAAHSFVKPSPYGVCLIMSPWNYPFLLTIGPLIDCLAAGNTAIIKPSAYSPATSAVIEKLIGDIFPADYVTVIPGGREENGLLLD